MLKNITASLLFALSFSVQSGQAMEQDDLEGFSKLHMKGITGKGTKVCVVEPRACDRNHLAFQSVKNQVDFISVGHESELPLGFKELSRRRYPTEEMRNFLEGIKNQNDTHGTHVGALIVSQPQQHQASLAFPGGIAPDAHMSFIAISCVYLKHCWQTPRTRIYGTALYSFQEADLDPRLDIQAHIDFDFVNKKFRDPNKGSFCTEDEYLEFDIEMREWIFSALRVTPYYKEKIDDSLLDAFDQAFKSGAKVLNFSMILASIADPLNEYHIPERFLQKIAQGLIDNDQVLVMAANNQGYDLSDYKEQVYFKQFSENPDISSRMLIVMNVYIEKNTNKIERFYSSNWPGKDLHDYTVSAFGTEVVSAYSQEASKLFYTESGTSQAAAKVSGFCLLIEQFHKDRNHLITSSEIVDFVKQTATPLGDPKKFGKGLINPDALLR